MKRVVFLICSIFLCSALSWGQTWKLTETMTATLDDKGVLSISTTKDAEAMPNYSFENLSPLYNNTSIKSVIIGNKITTIGSYIFPECYYLTSVSIPNTVTSIGESAFDNCPSLATVTIPNTVTTIGEGAFWACGLTSIVIPHSVTTIGHHAFSVCPLSSIQVDTKNTEYLSEDGILYNMNKTLLHTYPSGKNGTEFSIPTTVTTIGRYAFCWNKSLTSITIPNSVTEIGRNAFYNTTELKNVTVSWSIPLDVDDYEFYDGENLKKYISASTLHVPPGTKALYEAAPVWKDFGMIVESTTGIELIENQTLKAYASDGFLHISSLKTGSTISIYSIFGQLVYRGVAKAETERIPLNVNGIYFVTAENQTIKTVVE